MGYVLVDMYGICDVIIQLSMVLFVLFCYSRAGNFYVPRVTDNLHKF